MTSAARMFDGRLKWSPKAITGGPSSARLKLSDPLPGYARERANRYPVTESQCRQTGTAFTARRRKRSVSAGVLPATAMAAILVRRSQRGMTCGEVYPAADAWQRSRFGG